METKINEILTRIIETIENPNFYYRFMFWICFIYMLMAIVGAFYNPAHVVLFIIMAGLTIYFKRKINQLKK